MEENIKKNETEKTQSTMDKINAFLAKFHRVSATDKIFFTQNIGVMLKSGIPLSKALKTLSIQTENKKFSQILLDLHYKIDQGESLTNALEKYKKIFGELFVNMIKSGEISGNLENVLAQLYTQLKKNHTLIIKIRNALIYPVIILLAMSGIGTAMFIFVIPKIMDVFNEVNAQLPLATRFLIKFSNIISQHGTIFVISVVCFIIAFIKIIKTKQGKNIFDLIILKLPIISPIIKKINSAMFARTMSSLLKTDIQIVDSFKITSNVTNNSAYKRACFLISEDVKKGISISKAMLSHTSIFSPILLQMISMGEETGSLDTTLDEIAIFYEEQVFEIMNTLPSIIEPILMLVLGVAVGFMAVAIIMPMYSLTQQI
ncbi:type II secretion system F family protein [Patescibacteria group bacterium]